MKRHLSLQKTRFSLLAVLAGCGGHGPSLSPSTGTSATSRGQGAIHFKIKWSAPSRLIPSRAQKITLRLLGDDGSTGRYSAVLGEKDIVRPASDVTFPKVPTGRAQLSATAYPESSSGSTTAQATGTAEFIIAKDKTTEVSITMATTITRVAVTMSGAPDPTRPLSVKLRQSRDVTATAYDAEGNIVLTTPNQWRWSSKDPATVAVSAHGETATITGAGGGTTDL